MVGRGTNDFQTLTLLKSSQFLTCSPPLFFQKLTFLFVFLPVKIISLLLCDSLTCHYYYRCTCISYLMIPMLMSFEFNLTMVGLGFLFFHLSLLTEEGEDSHLLSLSQPSANVPVALQLPQTAFSQKPLSTVVPVWTCFVVPCDITAWYFYCFRCVIGVMERYRTKHKEGSICSGNILHLGYFF